MYSSLDLLVQKIKDAQSILLSTHRQCDGDGLGAQLATYFALRKSGKKVHCVNVDVAPKKYLFLQPDQHVKIYSGPDDSLPEEHFDLALVFDTNDARLVEPLYSHLIAQKTTVAFIDHHPPLKQGPLPTPESWIDITCASTGEMAYQLLKALNTPLDKDIAKALYTSVAFDTQIFRFIRNSPMSHRIAADLLQFDIQPDIIHRNLFAQNTEKKMAFLGLVLSHIEYFGLGRVALLCLKTEELATYDMDPDDSRDLIDLLMNIQKLQVAALFRQDGPDLFKMSLRSKSIDILPLAEKFGGGGHHHAAGALVAMDYPNLRNEVVHFFEKALPGPGDGPTTGGSSQKS
ncbi:MAG: DHH family phosphoesterase [Pseudobdellovibrionaceae bacterium]